MGRIRTIKPEFPQSESMGRVSREARLLFILLWTIADDSGRTRASSRMLASLLYPYDDDAKDLVPAWLDELEAEGCIRRYQVDGQSYLDIPNWLNHQKIDKPSKSKFPEFDESSRVFDESSRILPVGREGNGEEGKGKGPDYSPSDLPADAGPVDQKETIPYQAIADLYNQHCGPYFPKVSTLSNKRRGAIKQRWKADPKAGTNTLDYWSRYFAHCATGVEFLRKAAAGELTGQHGGWKPDFDFLMTEKAWLGVREGKYS
jgi:hypothetical protein